MSGLAQIAALLFTILGQIDLNGAVASETRAGEGPLVPGDAPQPGFVTILTPAVELQYLDRRLDLRAGYNLRILLRESSTYPNFARSYAKHRKYWKRDTSEEIEFCLREHKVRL